MKSLKLDALTLGLFAGFTALGAGITYFATCKKECSKKLTPEQKEEVTRTLRVCVTGSAGQIGYAFLPLLASGEVFGPHVKIQLRLLDIPECVSKLEGVAMELIDGAYPLLEDVQYGGDPKDMFKDCNVVVFIGGFPRKQGMERKDLLTTNGKIFEAQGKALNEVASKDVKCLVVANPANTNCLILQRNAPNIPKKNFTCLTRLDHNRAIAQLSSKSGIPVSQIQNVTIWGNHSVTQYADVNHGTILGKKIRSLVNDDDYLNNAFLTKVQKRGGEILAARGGTSVFSAANAVKDHLRDWYHGTADGVWTSMGIVSDGSYGVPEGLVFSYPVRTKKHFEYEIIQGLTVDKFSQEKIDLTTKELIEERDEAGYKPEQATETRTA